MFEKPLEAKRVEQWQKRNSYVHIDANTFEKLGDDLGI